MILLDSKDFKYLDISTIKKLFLAALDRNYIRLRNDNPVALNECISIFGEAKINKALQSFYIYKTQLILPEDSNGKILRYLEYGGENSKPTHLISETVEYINKLGG